MYYYHQCDIAEMEEDGQEQGQEQGQGYLQAMVTSNLPRDRMMRWGGEIGGGGMDVLTGYNLAEELRYRMKHANNDAHVSSGDDFDEIIKNQFDDDDFERTDNKELDMRRVREVSKIMAKIRKTSTEEEISGACEKLMDIISMWPEVTDHFIKHFGVTPIFDIFDACIGNAPRQPCVASSSSSSSSSSSVSINNTLLLSTYPINPPYQQHTLSNRPINPRY